MSFVLHELFEKDKFWSHFPEMDLAEARRIWLAMEEHFFGEIQDVPAGLGGMGKQRNLGSALPWITRGGRDA